MAGPSGCRRPARFGFGPHSSVPHGAPPARAPSTRCEGFRRRRCASAHHFRPPASWRPRPASTRTTAEQFRGKHHPVPWAALKIRGPAAKRKAQLPAAASEPSGASAKTPRRAIDLLGPPRWFDQGAGCRAGQLRLGSTVIRPHQVAGGLQAAAVRRRRSLEAKAFESFSWCGGSALDGWYDVRFALASKRKTAPNAPGGRGLGVGGGPKPWGKAAHRADRQRQLRARSTQPGTHWPPERPA